MQTSEQIQADIESRFGFFPPFFAPALPSPAVLENLWRQTQTAYLDNPLSALFKERLNALLSRYCAVPYCIICHSAALRPLGMTAGEVLALLNTPPAPAGADSLPALGSLPAPDPEEVAAPAPDSPLERTLIACATAVFLERAGSEDCGAELRRLLGPDLYNHLAAYLAYIRTCHQWMEMHPDVSYEADRRVQDNLGPLLAQEPALAEFFRHYGERIAHERQSRALHAAIAEERARSEAALRESEEKYRLLVEGARDYAMILLDTEGCIVGWNPGAERIFGYEEREMLGRDAALIFTPEDRDAGIPQRERETARMQGRAQNVRWQQRKDGSRFWADGLVMRLPDEDGRPRGFAKILRDATERKAVEDERLHTAEALQAAYAQTTEILESIGDAFYALDAEFRFTYVNHRSEELWGRAREELLGQPLLTVIPQAEGSFSLAQHRRAMTERRAIHYETVSPVLNRWIEASVYPGGDGGLSVYYRDISERKATEAALLESEARFRQMADAIPHIAWTTLADGSVEYYNQRWYRYSGLTLEKTRDWGWEAVIHPDDLARAGGVWRAAIQADVTSEVEYRLRRADGEYRWHLGRSEPIRDEAGQVIKWVGTATDITERREAEQALADLYQHDHAIATQLQGALQPAVPRRAPGLALAKYYEPALPEAGVGGDFVDCFSAEPGITFLVVGDLSGKGLAAAAQVATVRNMLRFALYNGRTLAGPVTSLNQILAVHELLSGFATLFVGRYDGGARTLTYVNCGQEPALLRRAATGQVEPLLPTGPIIGTLEGAIFWEQSVTLAPDDAFAVFTDGLTEAGPNRQDILGIEGVTALLEQPLGAEEGAEEIAERLMLRLISGVDLYAEQGIRDDVCLLIGVVE